jgi:hypothetical protein
VYPPEVVPDDIDVSVPNVARMYDYLLGGGRNFVADRELAECCAALVPGARELAWSNRSFLRRAVQFVVSQGVRQFLDLGSGIPTVSTVHEVAHHADPACRVVYVDCDPVAVAHTRQLLAGNDRAGILHADLRSPHLVLDAPETRRLLDFDQPVGLLMISVLHWLPDEDCPGKTVTAYRDAVPAGSFLALSHLTADYRPSQITAAVGLAARAGSQRLYPRTRDEITRLLTGFALVPPGLVSTSYWRPDETPQPGEIRPPDYLAAVARMA